MAWAIIIAALALAGIMAWASADIASGIYVRSLCRARTAHSVVALTFDDGPHPDHTPKLLDVLARHNVRATFFVVGERAEAHPEIVRRIAADGHLLGNHTYSHSARFPLMSARKMLADIDRCDAAISGITGTRPSLFRPPFGVTNPTLARALRRCPHTVTGWDVRSLDTMSRRPRAKVFERVRRKLRPGSVVLLHDDRADSDLLVEMILTHLAETDYKVERVDKLFGL